MTLSVAGLGFLSFKRPFADLTALIMAKGDLRSLFCLVVFCIVFLVLAYLTNPSETSFRTYLTEQSFRQHLSRLDDGIDEDHPFEKSSSFQRPSPSSARHTLPFDSRSPFHFANRASISLKTPKHVFHSFGLFTIAAMVPLPKSDRLSHESSMISDSWFIGAFGRWWRGGVLEAWYQDVIARPTEEGSWSSGILSMKTLDRYNEFNALPGLPFSTKNLPSNLHSRGSPPRLRNRDKSSQRSAATRASTPPPLPKSASLPLHRVSPPVDRNANVTLPPPPPPPLQSVAQAPVPVATVDQSALALSALDQSPRVAELLRQISQSKASVGELRSQLAECESSASQSHMTLQAELDLLRDRKRQEDLARTELKTRTKALDDSKRAAEGSKRDMEKRLKAAQTARDNATERMEFLDKEITGLQQRLSDDQAHIQSIKDAGIPDSEQEVLDTLQHKRTEIKVAEDVITALNIRVKEYEETLLAQKERLRQAQERLQQQKIVHHSIAPPPPVDNSSIGQGSHFQEEYSPGLTFPDPSIIHSTPSFDPNVRLAIRPANLTLGALSNFHSRAPTAGTIGFPARGNTGLYPGYDDSIAHQSLSTNFSPFADTTISPGLPLSPGSASLIPAGLISTDTSLDILPRSFKSETDGFMDRDWQKNGEALHHQSPVFPPVGSPVAHAPSSQMDHDPFEVRMLPQHERSRIRLTSDPTLDLLPTRIQRTHNAVDHGTLDTRSSEMIDITSRAAPRRWVSASAKDKPKKGLNPDAKVFSLTRKPKQPVIGNGHVSHPSFDALNPNGLIMSVNSSVSSDGANFLAAFAPSPAERRALGGSTNASLERLPSLSDVGSIPSSPSHVHAHAVTQENLPRTGEIAAAKTIPSWLQTLPRIRRLNFSPWDDEEQNKLDVGPH